MVATLPVLAVEYGVNYIEDITTQISQIALDKLGIPIQLSISQRKLQSILNEWKSNALPMEDREKACKQILNFYNDSKDLNSMFSYDRNLCLNNYSLRDLPDIFSYKPFSRVNTLYLSNN